MHNQILNKIYNTLETSAVRFTEWQEYYDLYCKMAEIGLISKETLDDFANELLSAKVICVSSGENVELLMVKNKLSDALNTTNSR